MYSKLLTSFAFKDPCCREDIFASSPLQKYSSCYSSIFINEIPIDKYPVKVLLYL